VLLVSERRNRIAAEDCDQFLRDLSKFYIETRVVENDERVVRLARTHRLSVYDAAYLALAIDQKMALATLDKGLQTAALSESIVLLS
jgi:predicted nucleic acid-binding protein